MKVLKKDLISPSRFRKKFEVLINTFRNELNQSFGLEFDFQELGDLILSAVRSNDFNVVENGMIKETALRNWLMKKLVPNTVVLKLDDEEVLKLLVFCLEITFQMFEGGTRATVTQKGFRERRRTFESIIVDQFAGKLGEVFVKRFLETRFGALVELDWRISRQITKFKNDILNAKKKVSIKTSLNLAGIWAEADVGYDYGIMVKCSLPKHPFLQFFIEVCGFSKLLDFIDGNIKANGIFRNYINNLKARVKSIKCEEFHSSLKGFICGYFETSGLSPTREGTKLDYLGVVKEERYLIPVSKLRWTVSDWEFFIKDNNLRVTP